MMQSKEPLDNHTTVKQHSTGNYKRLQTTGKGKKKKSGIIRQQVVQLGNNFLHFSITEWLLLHLCWLRMSIVLSESFP